MPLLDANQPKKSRSCQKEVQTIKNRCLSVTEIRSYLHLDYITLSLIKSIETEKRRALVNRREDDTFLVRLPYDTEKAKNGEQ